ncbi:uncharacterized protein LOC126569125 [Anopheles aquasalis]|uniref:uncharacterized protein LOC126569125 n=1 Tax=Anopheles aquasalis TaxID=42839 RepID=UPI00215A96F2|nr:uncharacterized protein LOC126569125 [Anopheles aquasalis]
MAMAGLCACVKHLSKEEIRKMIETLEKPEEFIKDENLRQMFRCENELGRTKGNAIKYLDIVEDSLRFQENPQLLDDDAVDFLMNLEPKFEDEYENITATDPDEVSLQRKQFLERVQSEYTRKLGEEERYKLFKEKLKAAYRGKIKIEKNP